MDIILSNSSDEPIYAQIATQIKALIMNGTLQSGDALPSMRTLATQLRISIITTKRAYDFLREEHMRQIEALLEKVCEQARVCDLSLTDLKEMLDLMYGG